MFQTYFKDINEDGTVGSFRKYSIGGFSPKYRRGGILPINGWVLRKTTKDYLEQYKLNYGKSLIGGIHSSRRVTTLQLSMSGRIGVSFRREVGTSKLRNRSHTHRVRTNSGLTGNGVCSCIYFSSRRHGSHKNSSQVDSIDSRRSSIERRYKYGTR